MASGPDTADRFRAIVAAQQALRDANAEFASDLAEGKVRVVKSDAGVTAFYRHDDRLVEATVEVIDVRTRPAPAPPAPPLV